MRILLQREGNRIMALDDDTREELGVGISPDEAIGSAVRNLFLSNDYVVIDDISSED